jgi:hypothetical protein
VAGGVEPVGSEGVQNQEESFFRAKGRLENHNASKRRPPTPKRSTKIRLSSCGFFGYDMPMSIDQIAAEALRLPARERALLAGSLWESLEDPSAAPVQMDETAIVAQALERDREIESGQAQAVPHNEMMARLRR